MSALCSSVPSAVRLPVPPLATFLATVALLAAIAVAAVASPEGRLGAAAPYAAATLLVILALPGALMTIYLATLRRVRDFAVWSDSSLPVRWLSGPWLSIGAGVAVAVAAPPLLALRLVRASPLDWILLALTPLVFLIVWRATRRQLQAQFQPAFRFGRPLWTASLLAAGLMVALELGARLAVGLPDHGSLPAAFDAAMRAPALLGTNDLAVFLAGVGGFPEALANFAAGSVAARFGELPALLLSILGDGALYLFVALSLAAFAMPAGEYARILARSVATDAPLPVRAGGVRRIVMVLLALSLAVSLSGTWIAERSLRTNADLREAPERARISVERIGEVLVREGTIRALDEARGAALVRREAVLDDVAVALDAGFDRMRGNVGLYLDWYYSLPSEYARLASMIMGDAEDFLARKVAETLGAGDPFADLAPALSNALSADAAIRAEFQETARAIVAANRVAPGADAEVQRIAPFGVEDMLILPEPVTLITVGQRLGISAAGGGIAGVASALIARRAASRLVASGSVRIAAKALQAMSSRTVGGLGGAAAGAAAGGAVGSVVPLFGTALGAVAGGIIGGIGVAVGTDYLVLKLEEALSREANRAAILSAIDANEAATRATAGLPARSPQAAVMPVRH